MIRIKIQLRKQITALFIACWATISLCQPYQNYNYYPYGYGGPARAWDPSWNRYGAPNYGYAPRARSPVATTPKPQQPGPNQPSAIAAPVATAPVNPDTNVPVPVQVIQPATPPVNNQKPSTPAVITQHLQSLSHMIGQPVFDATKHHIGTVSDLLFNHRGQAERVIIAIGGIMGWMTHPVSVPMAEAEFTDDGVLVTALINIHAKIELMAGQYRATRLLGGIVSSNLGLKLGDIADALLQHDGQINSLIIGLGGFLGIGAKLIKVPFKAFVFSDPAQLITDLSRENLESRSYFNTE